MGLFNCNCRCSCTVSAFIASLIIGVITAFLQITAVITVTPVFLWVLFGIAIVYLAVVIIAAALARDTNQQCECRCSILNTLLTSILGVILFALILLAVGVTATSVISAILVGLLLFFFSLTLTCTACYAQSLSDCAYQA